MKTIGMKAAGAFAVLLGALTLAGCGGSSGGTGLTGGTGRAAVLLTDSPREDYAHIWATIYHVELVPQSGAPVVVYDSAAGTQIDLRTLYDSSGQRFSFLGSAAIPAGTYTAINVTIAPTIQLFANGAMTATTVTVDSSVARNSAGNAVITDTFHSPKTLGATTNNLVVDFNLAHFILRDSKIIPVVEEGGTTGIGDPTRHNGSDYRGVVSALTGTAPVLTFTLTTSGGATSSAGTTTTGATITVVTSASTAIYGAGTLVSGANVAVTGTLDTTTNNLVATQIQVCPTGGSGFSDYANPRASGAATALDATAGTFTLTVTDADGFTPAQTTINVVTTTSTQYYADGGVTEAQAAFFTALAATPTAEVVGTYDATTNTLTATTLKVMNHAMDGGWENGPHGYREGVSQSNWGHGRF